MNLNMVYQWEMETANGTVLNQFEEDGTENTWKVLDLDKVIRISFISKIEIMPRHDVFIDHNKGEKFIRRFGRGFHKAKSQFKLMEYINCVVTNRYRVWIFSSGRVLVTNADYEVYV